MTTVYLAGPIDFAGGWTEWERQRSVIKQALLQRGYRVIDPSEGAVPGQVADPVALIDAQMQDIIEADVVLALFPPGIPTLGTPIEVYKAATLGRPVVVIGPVDSVPMQALASMNQIKLETWERLWDAVAWIDVHIAKKNTGYMAGGESHDVLYVKTHPDAGPWPARHQGDAGTDLTIGGQHVVPPGTGMDLPHDLRIEMPPGVWGLIIGRSSAVRQRGLLVTLGVIDNGYRGELFTHVYNPGPELVEVAAGERLSQLILFPLIQAVWTEVETLTQSDRGSAGFGSTGR